MSIIDLQLNSREQWTTSTEAPQVHSLMKVTSILALSVMRTSYRYIHIQKSCVLCILLSVKSTPPVLNAVVFKDSLHSLLLFHYYEKCYERHVTNFNLTFQLYLRLIIDIF